MNPLVTLFFVHNAIATVLIGGKFARSHDRILKFFGFGLLLDAFAFAMWTIGYLNPDQLLTFVTFGALALLASFVVFLYASMLHMPASTRFLMAVLGIVAVSSIFYVGRYVDPASAFISKEGFLFFNLTPLVQMLYTFALAIVAFPLIELVAAKFKTHYAMLIRYGLIAEVVGGIMLITNKDMQVLYITGWVVGIVYFVLWTTLLFDRKAWPNSR